MVGPYGGNQPAELVRYSLGNGGLTVTVGDEEYAIHAAFNNGTRLKSASVKRRCCAS